MNRRRALGIFAAAAGLPFGLGAARAREAPPLWEWHGRALGAPARLVLAHPDRRAARHAIEICIAETGRLEAEFSLFRDASALVRLNADGRLEQPSLDFRSLLSEAQRFGALTGGIFDVTIQPLWRLLAEHFADPARRDRNPDPRAVEAARALVDWRDVDVGADRIRLARRGMAVTLNGIAQGYITDRVADRLRDLGFAHVLVDLGELRSPAGRPDGTPWQVALDHARAAPLEIPLAGRAVATSSGRGTPFEPSARFNHLIDPRSGASPPPRRTVSVIAPRATTADALATALALLPANAARTLLAAAGPARAIVTEADGTAIDVTA